MLRASTEVTPLGSVMVIAPGSAAPSGVGERHPGVRAGGVRRVAVADAQHERLAGREVFARPT